MKIRVLRNLGAGLPDYTEGQEVEVHESEGEMLAKRGLCEILESAPKPKKAAAEKPAEKAEPKPAPAPAAKSK